MTHNEPNRPPPQPTNETERLAALYSYKLLDTEAEAALDQITRAASAFCGTEISLISLVDESRQWFKSSVGLNAAETPRDIAFCAHAILQPGEIMEVEDATLDPRFADNPLVTSDPNIRFYAGMPLTTAQGHSLGTLCVIDKQPRRLSSAQKAGLAYLGAAIIEIFDERLKNTLTPLVLEDSLSEIYIFDATTLKFIQVNRVARQNLGYNMDELLTMTPVDLKPAYTEAEFIALLTPLTLDEKPELVFNTVYRRRDGTDYLVEVHLRKMQFRGQAVYIAIIRDITERTQNKLDLIQANKFLDSAPDATVVVDEFGTIRFANQQMVNLLGYTKDELKGTEVDKLVPERFRASHATHRKNFALTPKVRGMGTGLDLSALAKDGREIPIEISLSPIRSKNGNLIAAAIRDISARKASEKELRLAKQAAEDAAVGKSQFLAAASHDLRQPLQALRLYLSALTSKLDQPKQIQLSNKMNVSLDSMGELLDALLDISTLESGSVEANRRDVFLPEFLAKLESVNLQLITEKGLKFTSSPLDCVIHTDPALLERIIENYITNAIRYTATGTISIACALHEECVRITVHDTGQGIPQNELEAIFNDFYQLDNAVRNRTKGLGLGLSIVKNIARILEHQTHVTSTLGKGSAFSVDVPLSQSQKLVDENVSTDKDILIATTTGKALTVLVVDDDPAIVDAMAEVLSVFDMKIATAEDGAEALAQIQEGLEPDFLLTDYRLPEMNGVELIIKVRAVFNKDIPVVIMTGDTSAGKIKEANLKNCTVLHKPVDIDQLLTLINSVAD